MSTIFVNGNGIMVITRGIGKLHLLSYASNNGGVDWVTSISTSNQDVTRFMLSFSLHYFKYAFFWEGEGEAVYRIGDGLLTQPVGRNWAQASAVGQNDTSVGTLDASSVAANASVLTPSGLATCYIIPDKI